MISRPEAEQLRRQLMELLGEDSRNARRLAARLDAVAHESGVGVHATLLLILTRYSFGEEEAKRHWEAIVAHRAHLSGLLRREVAIRVAALDHFIQVNRQEGHPTRIDLWLSPEEDGPNPVDPLTRLTGDRGFRAALEIEVRRARRYRQRMAVVLFDLDGFRAVNAVLGDLVADRILREVAILLHNKIRDIDLAARIGEDELALILPETDRNGALLVAERFRSELVQRFAHRDPAQGRVALTVSGGIASYPDDASTVEALLERAAQALYQAKATGKNNVRGYRPEWRRFQRVELPEGRFEVEVLAPRELDAGRARKMSLNGIEFGSPEPIDVGEEIEIRFVHAQGGAAQRSPKIRGRVVRLEELPGRDATDEWEPAATAQDRFAIGMVFDAGWGPDDQELLEFLESAQKGPGERSS